MKHLYEYFDCQNISEFKQLIMKEDEKIRPLFNLYEKLQEPIVLEQFSITSSSSWESMFLKHQNLPEEGRMMFLKFDTKNQLVGYKTFSENVKDKTIYNYLFSSETVSFGAVLNPKSMDPSEYASRISDLERTLDALDINFLDALYFKQDECAYYSLREGMSHSYELPIALLENMGKSKSKTRTIDFGLSPLEKQIMNSKDFNSFTHEYVKQELKGLSIIKDEDKIKKLLKLDHQSHKKEYFGILSYDTNNQVSSYSIEHVGGIKMTVAEPRSAMPYLTNPETKGIILYHNHPSGNPEPSHADIHVTEIFKLAAELIDKEVYDHYVISPKKVQSIAEYESRGLLNDKNIIQNAHLKSTKQHEVEER